MLEDLRILLVEDEALLALDLSMILEDEGAHVMGPCASVGAALDVTERPDIALLDVDLRGEPVFPVADRLVADGTPIVFHTGRADVADLRARYGADVPIIPKPSTPADLVARMGRAVAHH